MNGRPGTAMRPTKLSVEQISDLATFVHRFRVGGYDVSRERPASIVVGEASAGEAVFQSRCASCHSLTGDLKGFGAKFSDPRQLQQAWLMPSADGRSSTGAGQAGGGTIIGGEGPDVAPGGSGGGEPNIKGPILQVNGVLYVSAPDNAWAIDARDGHQIWHYFWKTRGGTHIANRGLGMYGDWLYMETPDDYLVSLEARSGRERWHKVIAPFEHQYFSTPAPVIIGNHVLVGTGNVSTRRGSCSRSIHWTGRCSGSSIRCR